MSDEKKAKKDAKKGIGDEIAGGLVAAKNPGYAAYRREAMAMGEEPLTAEEWASRQKRRK
jgi:hypothetical protein